jgi:hypothetical protein
MNMNLYNSKIIKEFPEEIIGKTSTPAGDHLFKIREDGRKLDDEMQTACWPSSRQYATFLGACCFKVTIETTGRIEIIVCCDTKKEMKMEIMRLKVGENPLVSGDGQTVSYQPHIHANTIRSAESSIIAPIIFSVFVTTNTALLHTLKIK